MQNIPFVAGAQQAELGAAILARFQQNVYQVQPMSDRMGMRLRGAALHVASQALSSREKVKETVALCKQNGLNNIFVVVWNRGMTMYPSDVVNEYIGIKQDPKFNGRDPIKEMIEEGHKAGLKVHAWFEFGFSYSYKDSTALWLQIRL